MYIRDAAIFLEKFSTILYHVIRFTVVVFCTTPVERMT